MSVMIRGVEMPSGCNTCQLHVLCFDYYVCRAKKLESGGLFASLSLIFMNYLTLKLLPTSLLFSLNPSGHPPLHHSVQMRSQEMTLDSMGALSPAPGFCGISLL